MNNWFCSFAKTYPEINLDIVLSNHYEDILDDSFDVPIRVGPLQSSEFIGQLLFSSELVLCATPDYLAQVNIDFNNVADIAEHDFLSFQQHKLSLKLSHKIINNNIEIPLNTRIASTSTAILRQAAIDGLGIACLPMISIQDKINAGELVPIFKEFIAYPSKDIYAVYPQ